MVAERLGVSQDCVYHLRVLYPTKVNGRLAQKRQKQPNNGERLPTSSVATVVSCGTDKSKLNRVIATGMVRAGLGMDTEGVSIYCNGNEWKVLLSSLPYIW